MEDYNNPIKTRPTKDPNPTGMNTWIIPSYKVPSLAKVLAEAKGNMDQMVTEGTCDH